MVIGTNSGKGRIAYNIPFSKNGNAWLPFSIQIIKPSFVTSDFLQEPIDNPINKKSTGKRSIRFFIS